MASRPKQRRFTAAIKRIATREGFTGADAALQWVLSEIEAGMPVAQLWILVQEEAKEGSSRTWSYTVLYGLTEDARVRIRDARKVETARASVAGMDLALEP